MTVAIVIVARDPRLAKTRLRAVLSPGERATLAVAMLDDVLAAATATRHAVLVVTDARSVAARARRAGARASVAPPRGTRDAAARGLRLATSAGAGGALVLAADLPLATSAGIRRIIAAGKAAPVVIVPDRRGSGTNALFVRPPDRIAPRFGRASLAAHRRAAAGAAAVLREPGLGFDVDVPEDLTELRRIARRAGTHTQDALERIASGAAPSTRRGSPSPRDARSPSRRLPPR